MVTLYTVHADGTPVYLPKDLWDSKYKPENVTPTSAGFTMEDNKSGNLTFTVLPDNLTYNEIRLISSTIKVTEYVYDDNGALVSQKILWKGRPISIEEDINGARTYVCEGALAFLNDIVCYPIGGGWFPWIFDIFDAKGIDRETAQQEVKALTAEDQQNMVYKYGIQDYLDNGGSRNGVNDEGSIFSYTDYDTDFFGNCTLTYGKGYNYMCRPDRKINVGNVDIAWLSNRGFHDHTTDGGGTGPYSPSEYRNGVWSFQVRFGKDTKAGGALDQILEMTVEHNGGHLIMRHETENGEEKMYLDYIGDISADTDLHEAQYGKNVIDFNGNIELNVPVTDIVPRGKCISTYQGEHNFTLRDFGQFTEWVGIRNNGYKYGVHLVNEKLVEEYGRIQQIVDFPDIDDPNELKKAGEEWLKTNSSFLYSSYDVSILDLGRVYGNSVSPVHLLDLVHVSIPGKLDDHFPVTKLEIDLLDPVNTIVTFSTTKNTSRTYELRSSGAEETGFQKIKAGDSISEALAGNLDKTKKLTMTSNANTSLAENVKDTNPEGKTGIVTVVTGATLTDDGKLNVMTSDLLFVNGLLTDTQFSKGGPEYNYLAQNNSYSDIIYRGIVKPARDNFMLIGSKLNGNTTMLNPFWEQTKMLFGNDQQNTDMSGTYYKYPYYNVDETADDLILDTELGSEHNGEYYRLVNDEKQYVPVPCMYYIPTGITGDMWVLYIGNINQHFITSSNPDGWGDCPALIGKHIANLGEYMIRRTNAKPNTYQRTGKATGILIEAATKKLSSLAMERLHKGLSQYMPSYTQASTIITKRGFDKPTSAVLLIAPYITRDHPTGSSTIYYDADIFITPAFVEPVRDPTYGYENFWYGEGYPARYSLRRMRIYTGTKYGSGYEYSYIPRDYITKNNACHADMNLETWKIPHTDVKTEITKPKYYLFSSEADMNAVIDAYKEGRLTQDEIEKKFISTIRFFGNSDDPTQASEMYMDYRFNNKYTSYYMPGNKWGQFL